MTDSNMLAQLVKIDIFPWIKIYCCELGARRLRVMHMNLEASFVELGMQSLSIILTYCRVWTENDACGSVCLFVVLFKPKGDPQGCSGIKTSQNSHSLPSS